MMANKFKNGKFDLLILLLLPIIAAVLSSIFKANYLWLTILFLGLPGFYLSIRKPKYIKKTALFSLLVSLPTIIVIDYIGQRSSQWIIPYSVLNLRIFHITQVEQLVWAYLNFYSVVIYYKFFLDKHYSKKLWGKRFGILVIIGLFLIGPFLFFIWLNPNLFNIPYFYFVFGFVLIGIPAVCEPLFHPNLATKFLKTAGYFFYLSLLFEITALRLDCCWRFSDNRYVGWIELASVKFPLEELIFWIVLFAMAILAVYEKFDENEL